MLNQFSRTQLLIGKEAMDRLSKTRVAIFGIGGVRRRLLQGAESASLTLLTMTRCALQTSIDRFLQQEKQ